FLKSALKPLSLSAVTSGPTPPQFKPGRHNRQTPELPRCRRLSYRRDFLRLSRIFAVVVLSPPGFSGDCYRFGHQRAAGACGGSWGNVALGIGSQCNPLVLTNARRRAVTTTPSSEPSAQLTSAATAPALMEQDHIDRRYWSTRGPCRQLKTAKVTWVTNSRISIGYDECHRAAPTAELHSSLAHDIGHVVRTHCSMQWKPWKVMPDEIKMKVRSQLLTNYHLEDLNKESMAYVNRLFGERYKQWKSYLHHHFEAFDDPQVALQEGCPKELEGQEDSWAWLCAHFQAPDYVNKAQVNKGNRKKKTLLHHSDSRPFSYRMDARRRLVLQESASQLPPETPIKSVDPPQDGGFQILMQSLDQTLGRRLGTYCRGMGNARQREPRPQSSSQANIQVTVLTSRVAELEGQMSVILQSLARSGIPIPNFGAPTFEPIHPEHPQQTTAPVDAQTSEPHVADDQVDFGTLFD
ncbi:unnamed protein product, partial [Prunus brigantina]